MLAWLWEFDLSIEQQKLLSWFGSGLVVITTGAWAMFKHFHSSKDKKALASTAITQSGFGITSTGDHAVIHVGPQDIDVDDPDLHLLLGAQSDAEYTLPPPRDKVADVKARFALAYSVSGLPSQEWVDETIKVISDRVKERKEKTVEGELPKHNVFYGLELTPEQQYAYAIRELAS